MNGLFLHTSFKKESREFFGWGNSCHLNEWAFYSSSRKNSSIQREKNLGHSLGVDIGVIGMNGL